MIQFSALERMVDAARKSLGEKETVVKPYVADGGPKGRTWRVAGFFATSGPDSRLVFEASQFESAELCLIRVYHEEPFEMIFERKSGADPARFEAAIKKAAMAFKASLPVQVEEVEDLEKEMGEMTPEEHEILTRALMPIPPPCNFDSIEEA